MKNFILCLHKILILSALVLTSLVFLPEKAFGQNTVIEEIIEEMANNSSNEDEDYQSIVDDLSFLLENPLNLNDANIESLEKLHFLSEFQIENLLEYISTKGPMNTIFELQLIEGLDMETIQKMLPFVMVAEKKDSEKQNFGKIIKYGNHKLIGESKFILQDQKGYIADNSEDTTQSPVSKYQGNNMKYLLRYRFNYKTKVFAGLTAEKDPGEKIEFKNNKNGFDFYSFHLQANGIGIFKNIVVGDYQAKFGQGLIFWSGFGLGKSPDAMNIRKTGQGIRYFSSTDENNFLRGAAATIKLGKIEATAFISKKKIDANLSEIDSLNNTAEKINTILNTGYHRTETEIQNRKVINESIIGSRVALATDRFKAGLNLVAYNYNIPFNATDKAYQLFNLKDNTNINTSIDYSYFSRKFYVFGEAAVSRNGAFAILNGMVAKVVSPLSFSILHRYYQKEYQASYATSFGENSKVNNEQGFYYGVVFHPVRKLKISAYADMFSFPWLKYGVNAPSEGTEYLVQTDYSLNRNITMYFRWKNETKAINLSGTKEILTPVVNENKQNFRYHISYQLSQAVSFRSRVEIVQYNKNEQLEYGFMLLQDVNLDFESIPLSFDLRYCMFDATYNARVYAYENDLLYNFSIPAYSGKGSRIYLLTKYKIGKKLDLRIRYSQFLFVNSDVISSGYEEIEGNRKSELKFQMVLRL